MTTDGPADPLAPRDPWERFGWLMWSGWLVFLAFPLVASLASDETTTRLLGPVVVVAFAAVYVVEVLRLTRGRQADLPVPEPVLALVLLVALALAAVPLIGAGALSFTPFVQSFAVFGLPRPAWWLFAVGGLVAVSTGTWLLLGPDELTLVFILVGVTAAAAAGRLLGEHSEAYGTAVRGRDVAEERERVARDVHDVLGHSLTVLSIKAELAQRLLDADPERARAELADIARLSREALGEVRATVGGLRAARLADELTGAGRALADRGIDADLPDDVRVADPRYRPVMGWVLREAVTNVVRHSGARRCVVRLEERSLVVEDDGRGLAGSREGHGLRGLRERVEQSGGRFAVGGGERGGVRLEVRW
ncbi:sensor histidine kinase [Nocardioides aequoreus]|uniref:sensor histidine kinase n=1 Tax=Nocardioides aequoreus TaxID=397278 RepID=UPI00068E7F39|nr:histidine kinase [Nocardioides aequoreus]